jgi:glucoamylase
MTRYSRLALRLTVPLLTAAMCTALPSLATASTSHAAGPHRGHAAPYFGSDKAGFGTSTTTRSKVWYTLQPGGGTGEIYYPTLDTPAARALRYVVVAPGGKAVRVDDVGQHATALAKSGSLRYRQRDTGPSKAWRLTTDYVTDPERSALDVHVHFASLDHNAYRLYVLYEPTLSNTPSNDRGRTHAQTLVAEDGKAASALRSSPAFTATSNGYRGVDDGWTDLRRDGRMDIHRASTRGGNLVQTGQTALTGLGGHQDATITVGYGPNQPNARATAAHSAHHGFDKAAARFDAGWAKYLAGLKRPPASLRTASERHEYTVSEMVLAASEDKTHRGAFVASPTMPWAWGAQRPSGPYHLVWSRDLYEIATALIADGDTGAARRALNFLFDRQQKKDGSFPQNSTVTGKPFWTGLQMDEVADPILLAYQLHRVGKHAYRHVKAAADFLVSFKQDGNKAPWTPQDRWENQDGYSPATIGSQIAGLVCAASIAEHNGHASVARRYLATADDWRARLKSWTVTTNGPYSQRGYFLRLTKNGKPNTGMTYSIGDSGPSKADQRTVVDPSFLELVRLGVLHAHDRDIRNTIKVVDRNLSYKTSRGRFWHRASFDGYGETDKGKPWILGSKPDSFVTHGRGWPLLNGERGEYDLAAGTLHAAARQLAAIGHTANSGGLLPEQVWDKHAPGGSQGFAPGTPTLSATPLAWTHAQFIRLAQDLQARSITEQPKPVAHRYLSH